MICPFFQPAPSGRIPVLKTGTLFSTGKQFSSRYETWIFEGLVLEKGTPMCLLTNMRDRKQYTVPASKLSMVSTNTQIRRLPESDVSIPCENGLSLHAKTGGDWKEYPCLYICAENKDGIETDLCAVSYKEGRSFCVYLYEDNHSDEYTRHFEIEAWDRPDEKTPQ